MYRPQRFDGFWQRFLRGMPDTLPTLIRLRTIRWTSKCSDEDLELIKGTVPCALLEVGFTRQDQLASPKFNDTVARPFPIWTANLLVGIGQRYKHLVQIVQLYFCFWSTRSLARRHDDYVKRTNDRRAFISHVFSILLSSPSTLKNGTKRVNGTM